MSEKKGGRQDSKILEHNKRKIDKWIKKKFNPNDREVFKGYLVDCINEVRAEKVLEWDKMSLDKRKTKAKKIEKAVNTIISELDHIPKTFKVCDYVQMRYLLASSNVRNSINEENKRLQEYRRKHTIYIDGYKLSSDHKHILEETIQDVLLSFVYDVNDLVTEKKYKRPNTGEPVIRYAIKYFADFLRTNVLELNNIKEYPNEFIASCVYVAFFPDLSTPVDGKYVENILKEIRDKHSIR